MNLSPLPRGRHGIPPEEVEANQRARMLAAAAELIGEVGYSSIVVGDVIARAGVSRATFYRLFDDKRDCVLAAQRWSFENAVAAVAAGCAKVEGEPRRAVQHGVAAALRFAADNPGQACLVLASDSSPAEPGLRDGGLSAWRELGLLLRRGRPRAQGKPSPATLTEEAAIAAAIFIVGERLSTGQAGELPNLAPSLSQMLLGSR